MHTRTARGVLPVSLALKPPRKFIKKTFTRKRKICVFSTVFLRQFKLTLIRRHGGGLPRGKHRAMVQNSKYSGKQNSSSDTLMPAVHTTGRSNMQPGGLARAKRACTMPRA